MSKKKVKGTLDLYLESMTPEERKKFDEGYRELLISEMILAAMEKDDISVRKLAKKANVSPSTVQALRSGISDSAVRSLFKVFRGLGYTIYAEKDGERLPLVIPDDAEQSHYEEIATECSSVPRIARSR